MKYEDITRELRNVIKEEEGKTYSTFSTNVKSMAQDCLSYIEETNVALHALKWTSIDELLLVDNDDAVNELIVVDEDGKKIITYVLYAMINREKYTYFMRIPILPKENK